MNLSEKISKNFRLSEAVKSSTADRLDIDNTHGLKEVFPAIKLLAEKVVQPIRDWYRIPFSPSSWYRSPELEKVICRKAFERWAFNQKTLPDEKAWYAYLQKKSHPRGEAVDLEIPTVPNPMLFDWIKNNLEFDQLILEFYNKKDPHSGWVHVSFRAEGNRHQVFEIGG